MSVLQRIRCAGNWVTMHYRRIRERIKQLYVRSSVTVRYGVTRIQKKGFLPYYFSFLLLACCLLCPFPLAKEPSLGRSKPQVKSPSSHIKGLHFPRAKWQAHNRKELSKLWIIWVMSRREEISPWFLQCRIKCIGFQEISIHFGSLISPQTEGH